MPVSITADKFPTFEECGVGSNCISPAPSQGFRRCRNPINAADRATASTIRQNIMSCITKPGRSIEDDELRDYAVLSCCKRWHRDQVVNEDIMSELVSRWRKELAEQRRRNSVETRRAAESRKRTPPRFEVYDPMPSMLEIISRPLTAQDQDERERSLYCASRTSDPGFYKISYHLSGSLFRQVEQMQSCAGAGNSVRMDFSMRTLNARRAQVLLYTELQRSRRQERTCRDSQCKKKHGDWFEINLNEAKRIMGRWANWMDHAQPYDDEGQLRSQWQCYCQVLHAEGSPTTSQKLYRAWLDGLVEDEDSDEDESSDEYSSEEDSTDDEASHFGGENEPEENDCPICFETMANPARTTCGHEFCADCIAEVFRRDNRCPLCRAELVDGVVGQDEVAEIPMQNTTNAR
jgi:hypothetical protein